MNYEIEIEVCDCESRARPLELSRGVRRSAGGIMAARTM